MKRLISVFIMICMVMTMGCVSASAADESASEDLSAADCISGVVIGDSVELTVTDADETIFEMHDEGDTDLSILPRVTVPNGCESCIKRITVWPAHYDSTDKTIRYLESMYAFYTWPEATSFGGTLGVPTTDTFNLMYAFSKTISLQRQIFQVICTSPRPTRILSISASTTVSLSSMSILSQSFIYPLMVSMFRFPYISADI